MWQKAPVVFARYFSIFDDQSSKKATKINKKTQPPPPRVYQLIRVGRGGGTLGGAHRVPCFLSSRPNWVPPLPHPQGSVAPPPFGSWGGSHTCMWGRGWWTQFQRRNRHSGTVCIILGAFTGGVLCADLTVSRYKGASLPNGTNKYDIA
jgi:hypothetical protein